MTSARALGCAASTRAQVWLAPTPRRVMRPRQPVRAGSEPRPSSLLPPRAHCEARGDIFLQSRPWIPLLRLHIAPACHRLQRQEFYFKSSKRDHVSHLSTVTVMKDAFLLFSFPFPPHAVNITRGSGN